MTDDVMKEVWKIKDTISQENDKDVRALADRLRKRDRPADQIVVNLQKDLARPGSR